MANIEHWSAVAATLVDLAKRDLPPHISEAEQVEAYLGLKRIAADYRGAVEERDEARAAADEAWAWVEKACAAGGWATVFDIPDPGGQ